MSSTIWNEIAEQPPVVAAATTEKAGGLEELAGLERAPLQVLVDRRVGIALLASLHRLAARQTERRLREHGDTFEVTVGRELRERPGEEIVAGRPGRVGAESRPGSRLAAAHAGSVDQVVVHERRHVNELHGRAGRDGRPRAGGCGEEREHRSQPLAACRQRFRADLGDESRVPGNRSVEELLDVREVVGEAGGGSHRLERRAHRAVAVWSATIEPPKSRNAAPSNPTSSISAARSSAPGKRRTLAGR